MIARHDYLIPASNAASGLIDDLESLDRVIDSAQLEKLRLWITACCLEGRLPCIRRRGQLKNGRIPVGIPSPWKIGGNRIRAAAWLHENAVARVLTPVAIAALHPSSGSVQHDILSCIKEKHAELKIGLIGSLASEIVSSEKYVDKDSDLDIIIAADDCGRDRLQALMDTLAILQADTGVRIDCECRVAAIGDFSLKEFFSDASEILVRRIDDVDLVGREILCNCLAGA